MKAMSPIVRTMTGLLFAPIFLFGAYIILHGHLTPGGGFQGGAIIATGMALFLVAFGSERWRKKLLSILESTGLMAFVSIGFLGIVGGLFLYNFLAGTGSPIFGQEIAGMAGYAHPNSAPLLSSGTVALLNMFVGLEVVSGLTLIVVTLGLFAFSGKEDD
ncbi:MAG: MnhB domain-containing protein [Candidatus Thermoplasmatota archaeon]|nr:MnhB domain-containing protein [Candidatus Thermoplasmatota archaeon]